MPAWLYHQGHIGWPLFASLLYTGLLALVIDYAWRRVTLSFGLLIIGAAVLWIIGLVLIGFTLGR